MKENRSLQGDFFIPFFGYVQAFTTLNCMEYQAL
nr:MAG TPA: hypothetical protein [Caudoviricetes sp.]